MSSNPSLEKFKEFAPKGKQSSQRNTREAVILTRVSSRDQMINGASLSTQQKYCEEFAERQGLLVTASFGGTYESAKSDERKEFQRMLQFVKRKKTISYIIVYSYDRFSRTGANGAHISEDLMKKHGVTTLSVSQPIDPTTTSGSFQQNLYYLFGKYDNEQRREKSMSGMIEKIRSGYWVWQAPLGYTNLNLGETADKHQLVINNDGKLLKQAFQWKAKDDLPYTVIAQKLRIMGLKTTHKQLSKIFRNPFYCGIITSSIIPGEAYEGKHKPLIDQKTFLKINSKLDQERRGYKIDLENDSLPLKVFLKCDSCDTPMTGYLVKKKNLYYYKCRTKGCAKNRNASVVKNQFESLLSLYQVDSKYKDLIALQMEKLFYTINEEAIDEQKQLKASLTEIQKKLESIEERFVLGEIKKSIYEKWSAKFQAEKTELRAQLDNCSLSSSNLKDCVNYTINLSSNLLTMWRKSNYVQKQNLQRLVFPEGVWYNRELDRVRTKRVNSFFSVISNISNDYDPKKEKRKHLYDTSSLWVEPQGFEPWSR